MTLTDIQESFYSRSFDLKAVEPWLWGVGITVLVLAFFLVIKAIKARRIRYFPHGSITDPKMIQRIIRQAFDQRRPFEVQVQTLTGHRRPILRCSPEVAGTNSMTVEINGLQSLSDKWLGRAVAVFFRIHFNGEYTYYTFASRIDGIHLPQPGVCHITLPFPTSLENRQKRSFLRMAPPQEFLMGAALWHGDRVPSPERLTEIAQWPRPTILLIPGRMTQFSILDLSAGGIRLAIPNKVIRAQDLRFTAADEFIVMLDLFDPDQSKRLRFWMQCRAQNIWIEHNSRDAQLGLQFQAWARPREGADMKDNGAKVEWLRLSHSNEVEPVGNWIMRRHLELFRELPEWGAPERGESKF